jgi:hypothetical protein
MKERIAQLKAKYQNYSAREKNDLKRVRGDALLCRGLLYGNDSSGSCYSKYPAKAGQAKRDPELDA